MHGNFHVPYDVFCYINLRDIVIITLTNMPGIVVRNSYIFIVFYKCFRVILPILLLYTAIELSPRIWIVPFHRWRYKVRDIKPP